MSVPALPKNKTRKALSDELFLYTTKGENPASYTYEVECTGLKACKFTLNFTGSVNFKVEGKSDMIMTVTVRPFHRADVGKISVVDEYAKASLKMGCTWLMEEPNDEETAEYLRKNQLETDKHLSDAARLNFPMPLDDIGNVKVKEICTANGKSFVDLSFPPTDSSLYKNTSLLKGEKQFKGKKNVPIEWKRPSQFMTGEYFVFHNGIDPSDIRQGALGDCWFLCAIAAMTEFPELVEQLFPDHDVNEAGVYNVRFCKNGFWQTVRVDDYFPCYPGGGPIYSRCNGNELWVLLLEKAYSKLCGCYEAIKSGWAYEGMMDLTGAPYKTIRLDDSDLKPRIENGELWEELLHYDLESYIMSASTPGEDVYTETGARPGKNGTGLVAGHAYTLISVKNTSTGVKLVKLRNPWGSTEWNGDWSDHSPLWTEQIAAEMGGHVKEDDGSFWMCFEDMLKHFYSVNICMTRHIGRKHPWYEARRKFHYDFDNSEGIEESHRLTCPNYILKVTAPGTFIVSVHQEDIRCANAKPYMDIGVSVLKVNVKVDPTNGDVLKSYTLEQGTGNTVERQNQTKEFHLENGEYLVVPTTTGTKLKQYFHQYLEDMSTKVNTTRLPLTYKADNGEIQFTKEVYRVYEELFTRMDYDGDGYLSKHELDQYMIPTEGTALTEKAYKWLIDNFETIADKHTKGLTLAGLIRAQLFVFKHKGGSEDLLWNEFKILGYDEHLNYESGRAAALVVHSTGRYTLESTPFDYNAYKEASELPVIALGENTPFEDGLFNMYKFRSGYHGLSFVIQNHNPKKTLSFTLDCSKSMNVMSNRDSLESTEKIAPGESKVMCHLMPKDSDATQGWSWAYSASYNWE